MVSCQAGVGACEPLVIHAIGTVRSYIKRALGSCHLQEKTIRFFVDVNSLMRAVQDCMDMASIFGHEFDDRCKAIVTLAETRSPDKLRKSFAIAAQSVDKLSKAVGGAGQYLQTLDGVIGEFEDLLDELMDPMAMQDDGSTPENVTEQANSLRSKIDGAAKLVSRIGPKTRVGVKFLFQFRDAAKSRPTRIEDESKSVHELLKDACVQVPFDPVLNTALKEAGDKLLEESEAKSVGEFKLTLSQ